MHIFLCNHTLQSSAISLSHGSKWCLEKTFWWHGQDMLGRSKHSPSACHECKYVGWFKLGRNCFSCLLFCWFPPPTPTPLILINSKFRPHWATIEHTFIFHPALFKAFVKGVSKQRSSFVSVPLMCTHPAGLLSVSTPPASAIRSVIYFSDMTHSYIYMLWKAGRPAHWRPSKACWLVWEFPSSPFSLDRIVPDVRHRDGGESCWWIRSEVAVFSKDKLTLFCVRERERERSPSSGERALLMATWVTGEVKSRQGRGREGTDTYPVTERETQNLHAVTNKPDERNLLGDSVTAASSWRRKAKMLKVGWPYSSCELYCGLE